MSDIEEFKAEEPRRLQLFEATGVELEYMIVDRETCNVRPIADSLIYDAIGTYESEVEKGRISWSNELALHVIELKTNGPARDISTLHEDFQQQVAEINALLETHNARLMPTAMHPWMNSDREMKLWPHEYNPVYEAYNRIFDCRGHGWANVQSTHINLPFADDEEFEKLHAAVRILLPILPGIAASSPIADLKRTNFADYRLEAYRTNSQRVPSVTGHIIPEAVFSEREYSEYIFERMYRDIAPLDTEGLLQEEWLNSRGAIPRFDRGSIEIRVLDIQECPLADMAVVRIIVDTIKALVDERWAPIASQKSWSEITLKEMLLSVMREGEEALIHSEEYTNLFGLTTTEPISTGRLWRHIFDQLYGRDAIDSDPVLQCLDQLIKAGTLSHRILKALPNDWEKEDVQAVYHELCDCLDDGRLFQAEVKK